jgi:hypothetical protein
MRPPSSIVQNPHICATSQLQHLGIRVSAHTPMQQYNARASEIQQHCSSASAVVHQQCSGASAVQWCLSSASAVHLDFGHQQCSGASAVQWCLSSASAVHLDFGLSSASAVHMYIYNSSTSAVHQRSSSMTYLQPRVMVAINGLKLHNAYSWT